MLPTAPKRIAPGVAWHAAGRVNVYFLGRPGGPWALVDTGPPGRAEAIAAAARARFGGDPPVALVLTHGHCDHAGNAAELADLWNAPVYAHPLELPYLRGLSDYPPPDPLLGGFLAPALMSQRGRDLGERVQPVPERLPGLEEWEVIATPGHSPGHLSLFRPGDRTLIAGDAFATADSASPRKAPKLSPGPVAYNCDWVKTIDSARRLAALRPQTVAAGHGAPLQSPALPDELAAFAARWRPPERGRYVLEPARTGENGVVSLPPPVPFAWLRVAWRRLFAIGGAAGAAAWLLTRRRRTHS